MVTDETKGATACGGVVCCRAPGVGGWYDSSRKTGMGTAGNASKGLESRGTALASHIAKGAMTLVSPGSPMNRETEQALEESGSTPDAVAFDSAMTLSGNAPPHNVSGAICN